MSHPHRTVHRRPAPPRSCERRQYGGPLGTIAVVHHRYGHFQPAARAARWHVGRTRGGGFVGRAACWPRPRRVLTLAHGAPSATLRGWDQPKGARAQWVSRWTHTLQVVLNHVPGAFGAEPTLIALHGCVFAVAGYFRNLVDFQRAALPTEVASRSPNSDRGATSAGPGSHFWRVGSTK